MFGSCAPELQRIAVKVLSQTTSASNCERNWSTFSYIHTKTRNRLKYLKLQKLVFTFYNMKLKMRHDKRRSQEEIENSFNPINLDYIFCEVDPLAPWLEEREEPLLDGLQNSEWLPRIDSDDEDNRITGTDGSNSSQTPTQSDNGGLSPPSDNDDGNNDESGGNETSHGYGNQGEYEGRVLSPYLGDHGLAGGGFCIDMAHYGVNPSSGSTSDTHRGGSQSRRRRQQHDAPENSSSISMAQSFSDFGVGESSQSSQSYYPPPPPPPYYQPFPYNYPSYGYYPQESHYYPSIPSYNQPPHYFPSVPFSYQEEQVDNTTSGSFDFSVGQGWGSNDNQGEGNDYDPPRHSTMW
jgi:hypothetical protein